MRLAPVRRRMAAAWAVALVLGAAAAGVSELAWRRLPHPVPLEELSYYPSGHHLRPVTLGQAESAADLAWLRAVQYYGEHRRTDLRFTRMEQVFDVLTNLSPGFVSAYVFGGFALAQEGGDPPAGERLLLKGMQANPGSGRLAFELGFFYYVHPGGRDLPRAAEYFEQAARQEDSPPLAARFAAFAHQNAGDLGVAYALWENVARTSENAYLRQMAEHEMAGIRQAMEMGRKDLVIRPLGVPQARVLHSGS